MWRPEETLRFDEHQFDNRLPLAVSAETEISFDDYSKMHVPRSKGGRGWKRRLPTPQWAINDEQLRAVVLRYAEDRFYIRDHSGTPEQRMARITAEVQRWLPVFKAQLQDMMEFYAKHQMKHLPIQIQNKDTEIVVLKRGVVTLATAIVYRIYRQGYNSVQVAEELSATCQEQFPGFSFKSPMIRMWLYRLHTIANRLGFGGGMRTRNNTSRVKNHPRRSMWYKRGVRKWTPALAAEFLAYRKAGNSLSKCAAEFGMKRPQDAWAVYARLTKHKGPGTRRT